jgi:hypothetical protein
MQRRLHGQGGCVEIAQLFAHDGERLSLFGLCVEHMQDHADQDRLRRTVPEILIAAVAMGIDQNLDEVLHVANFVGAFAHFEERIERCGIEPRRRESKHRPQCLPEAGCAGKPVPRIAVGEFAFDVEHQG